MDIIGQKPECRVSVFTTKNTSPFAKIKYLNTEVFRLGSVSEKAIVRYVSYIVFNLFGTLLLFTKRPDSIIVYETLSIFPAFIYSRIMKHKKIHIHYHEYISEVEKNNASGYMKYLFKCEGKLLRSYSCSHTNEDRKKMFLAEYSFLKAEQVFVFPNLPPRYWWTKYGQHKKPWNGGKIKLVYVGALDVDTMFLEEILNWVKENPNELEITLFSYQFNIKTKDILNNYSANNIFLKPAKDYSELPAELVKFDIGLVMYKGHIPNVIYSVPNKVFEYLHCGNKVLSDKCLVSLGKLNSTNIVLTKFNEIQNYEISKLRDLLKRDFTNVGQREQFSTLIDQI